MVSLYVSFSISRMDEVVLTTLRKVSLNHWNYIGRKQEGLILQNNTSVFALYSPTCMKSSFRRECLHWMYLYLIWQSQTTPQPPTSEQGKKKNRRLQLCNMQIFWTGAHRCGLATQPAQHLFSHLLKKKTKQNKTKTNREKNTLRIKVMINLSGTKRIVWGISGSNLLIQINNCEQEMTISPEED